MSDSYRPILRHLDMCWTLHNLALVFITNLKLRHLSSTCWIHKHLLLHNFCFKSLSYIFNFIHISNLYSIDGQPWFLGMKKTIIISYELCVSNVIFDVTFLCAIVISPYTHFTNLTCPNRCFTSHLVYQYSDW